MSGWTAGGLGALLFLAGCGGEAPAGAADSVLLITLDTTRQDALSCYAPPAGRTPVLDRIAAEGITYLEARASAPITLPSHASMLTGLWPPRHGLRVNGVAHLSQAAETLAERARARGLETAAFVAAVVLDSTYALDQGFDLYDQVERPEVKTSAHYERRSAAEVVDAARRWLAGRDPARPYFAWVHLFDPHQPWAGHAAYSAQGHGNPYWTEVAYADAQIGRLLEAVDLDRTLLLVVGDHGEALGDHGEETHGNLCYESTVRVPFLVRWPDGRRAGERALENVSVADVYPTVCEVLGLAPGDVDGVSLVRPVPPGRGVYVESWYGYVNYGWSPLVGWVQDGRKYLHSSTPEFYDLRADPGETHALDPAAAEAWRRAIAAVEARPRLPGEGDVALDEELLGQMAALGYVFGGTAGELPDPLAPTTRKSPREGRAELALIQDAFRAAEQRGSAAAERAWRAVLEVNPANPVARGEHAYHLLQLRRFAEAAEEYRRANATGPPRSMNWMNLGVCIESQGNRAGAIPFYREALELDPRNRLAQENYLRAMTQEGRAAEAQRTLSELLP